MTEYELIALLRETASTISQDFEFFITLTFAVIFVSYAVGKKLKTIPRIVISILYLASVTMLLLRYQSLLVQVQFINSNLTSIGSDFPEMTKILLTSVLRQSIYILGSLAAIYSIFIPIINSNEELIIGKSSDDII